MITVVALKHCSKIRSYYTAGELTHHYNVTAVTARRPNSPQHSHNQY